MRLINKKILRIKNLYYSILILSLLKRNNKIILKYVRDYLGTEILCYYGQFKYILFY